MRRPRRMGALTLCALWGIWAVAAVAAPDEPGAASPSATQAEEATRAAAGTTGNTGKTGKKDDGSWRRARDARKGPQPSGLPLDSLGDPGAPFSIRSDELEVSEGEDARRLTFRGNVEARRGDLVLQAGRLEATYPAGSKRPSRLSARGSAQVPVRVQQGEREARCREADYRDADQKIHCRGDAVLRDGSDELQGDAIVFDLRQRTVHVEGGTRVALQPRDDGPSRKEAGGPLGDLPTDGPVSIRAAQLEALEADDGSRRVRFEGSVEVAQEDLTLRARQIEAVYPPDARQPERLIARGDVRVTQRDREARCEEAIYQREARRVDCEGSASLRAGSDQVFGDRIAFDLEAERLVISGDTRLVLAPREREESATR